ncbi:MAG: hypothetical protein QOH62_1911 [Solirubrobacteraceae bacterium]|nr:hypothetical protein [Solirubrobacteraceae bacterium]
MARVALRIPDLMLHSRVLEVLRQGGHEIVSEAPDVLVVDVMEVAAEDVAGQAPALLGVFAHTQPEVREQALAAGFDLVVPRSRMVREGAELVARLSPS